MQTIFSTYYRPVSQTWREETRSRMPRMLDEHVVLAVAWVSITDCHLVCAHLDKFSCFFFRVRLLSKDRLSNTSDWFTYPWRPMCGSKCSLRNADFFSSETVHSCTRNSVAMPEFRRWALSKPSEVCLRLDYIDSAGTSNSCNTWPRVSMELYLRPFSRLSRRGQQIAAGLHHPYTHWQIHGARYYLFVHPARVGLHVVTHSSPSYLTEVPDVVVVLGMNWQSSNVFRRSFLFIPISIRKDRVLEYKSLKPLNLTS